MTIPRHDHQRSHVCKSKARTTIYAVHVHVIERSKIVSVHSEVEAYKISVLGSFGTGFLEVHESNDVWKCYVCSRN